MENKLPRSFYMRDNVVVIAKDLIGKVLYTNIDGTITAGIITETEAYRGTGDRACHGRICTPRTQVMFGEGGFTYTYLCYGIHILFNIVTNVAGKSDAILIRAIQPTIGIEKMLERQNKKGVTLNMTTGPGKVTKALGIKISHYGTDLTGDTIWVEEGPEKIVDEDIIIGPRVGVDYAGEDALLPWRFRLKK